MSTSLPQRSYYIETSLTSSELSPIAAGLFLTTKLDATIQTSLYNVTLNTTQTGIFAIVTMDGTYCVIHAMNSGSTTVQQSGLACTIAPSASSARLEAEPSNDICGGMNPCTDSVVTKLAIDSATNAPNNNNAATNQSPTDDNMGASSMEIIVGAVLGVIGLIVLVVIVAMIWRSRTRQHYNKLKQQALQASLTNNSEHTFPTAATMWTNPSVVMSTSSSTPPNEQQRSRGTSTHVRTQTELNYAVNPMQYNVAVDIHDAQQLQLAPPPPPPPTIRHTY